MSLDVGFVVVEVEAVLLTLLVVLFSLSFDGIIGRGIWHHTRTVNSVIEVLTTYMNI